MSFTSLPFLAFVVVAALAGQGFRGPWRLAFLIGLSAIFAATYIPDPLAALPLLMFVMAGYGAIVLSEGGRVRHAVALTVLLLVAAFVWLKRYPFVDAVPVLPFPYVVVGLSYILFRLLHLVFEVGDGALARPSFPRYLAYLFFFPAFLSGPIHRYEPFSRDLDTPAPVDSDAAYLTLRRFLVGFVKVAVIGECLILIQSTVAARLDAAVAGDGQFAILAAIYGVGAGLYLLFLYANFSGYTDMAIAVARLFGVILPENFNRPFMASNFQDFWSRWHITLSEWFKIYFFNPLLKALMQRFPARGAAPYLGVIALFIVFVVLGAWHGSSWEYLLTGVLLGVGVAINKLYQVEAARWLGKKRYQRLAARAGYAWAARGLTLAWVALSLTPFWIPVASIGVLVGRAGAPGILLSLVLLSLAFALPIFILTRLLTGMERVAATNRLVLGTAARVAILGALMVLLAFAVPLVNSSTDLVYQAF